MCGGGGSPPPERSPREKAEAEILLLQEQDRINQANAERERIRAAAQRTQDLSTFNTNLGAARNTAFDRTRNEFDRLGADFSAFEPRVNEELDFIRGTIPELASNPAGFFNDSAIDNIIGDITNDERRGFTRSLDEFAGSGFERNRFADTFDDNVITQLISEQFEPGLQQIDNAFKRGNLDSFGRDQSNLALENARTAANARLQDIGQGILAQGRSGLTDIARNARDDVKSFELGGTFDSEGVRSSIDSFAENFGTGLEGQFRNTLGGEELFDINSILQTGGRRQAPGPGAAGGVPLIDAIAAQSLSPEKKKKDNAQRGIGGQGAF